MTTHPCLPALLFAGLAMLAAQPARAQTANPTPGLPAATTHAPVEVTPEGAPPTEAPPIAPAGVMAEAERSAELLQLIEQGMTQVGARSAPMVKPPPANITVEPGKSTRIPIALGVLNRIQTPFADPVVKHGEGIAVEVQGGALYVGSNSPTPEAVFVTPRGDDAQTIVLTLTATPGLDPIAINLHLSGYEPRAITAAPGEAAGFEASQPYVGMLKALFRDLALGHVPQGYGLAEVRGASPWMPLCRMPGISLRPSQVLEGGSLVAVVARAVNTSGYTTEISEAACAAPGVLAVAAWPSVRLEPGEEAEIYIAVRRPDDTGMARRPSTLRQGG